MTKREYLQQLKPRSIIKIEVKGCREFEHVRFYKSEDGYLYHLRLKEELEFEQELKENGYTDEEILEELFYYTKMIPIEHIRQVGPADPMTRVLYE